MTIVHRRTLVLLGIALVLVLVRIVQLVAGEDAAFTPTASPFTSLDVVAITELVVEQGDDRLTFVQEDGTWRMTTPMEDTADEAMLRTLLERLRDTRVRRIAAEDLRDLASFGLDDDSALRITALGGGGPLARARVGSRSMLRTYLLVEDTMHVLEVDGPFPTSAAPDAWRARNVLGLTVSDITEVEVRGREDGYALRRTEAGFDVLRGELVAPVDRGAAEAFLTSLSQLRATAFLAQEDAPGLDNPVLTVRILAGEQERTLRIGGRTPLGDYAAATDVRGPFAVSALDVRALEEPALSPLRAE